VLQDILIAIVASIWLLAPLGALLWFNWRAAVFGPLAFVCLGVFPLAMFAAGNSAWQPGGSNSIVRLMGHTWGRRLVGFLLGMAVSTWMLTFYPAASSFWSTVGTPP
jgi:hypothetical protein